MKPTSSRSTTIPAATAVLAALTAVLFAACSGPDPAEPDATAVARFRPWPLGNLGVYTAQVAFDRAGQWGMDISVDETRLASSSSPESPALSATVISTDLGVGTNRLAFAIQDRASNTTVRFPGAVVSLYGPGSGADDVTTTIQVKEKSSTPAVGSPAPASVNKTGRDVETLDHLTTAPVPDPDLYRMTIREALASGMPLVVSFATPGYCQTATCGPQVEVLSEVRDRYRGRANFIHVEVFDNPHEIQGDLGRARAVPSVDEWGLPTEPWTFVVDGGGAVSAKFEAFATAEEIEEGLAAVLQ
ncbi:MAG: hypothetical protein J4F43_01940 [Dehalococcoidia bacterium]|nr:hypothetical protein [Dehalococcoidia bacterium]